MAAGVLPTALVYVGPPYTHTPDFTLTECRPHFLKHPLKDKCGRVMLAAVLESLLIYATATADLEISIGMALFTPGCTWCSVTV